MSDVPKVPRRIAAVIVNSLKGGVVPRIGLPYITVGREREIQALLHDLELVADGGASSMERLASRTRASASGGVALASLRGLLLRSDIGSPRLARASHFEAV